MKNTEKYKGMRKLTDEELQQVNGGIYVDSTGFVHFDNENEIAPYFQQHKSGVQTGAFYLNDHLYNLTGGFDKSFIFTSDAGSVLIPLF